MPPFVTALLGLGGPLGALLMQLPSHTIGYKIGVALVGLTAGGGIVSGGILPANKK